MTECIFCKIIAGEIPCSKLYEDEHIFAFLDIAPVTPGHTLVVPKHHCRNLFDIPEQILQDCALAIKKIGTAVKIGMRAEGLNVGMNNEGVAGQVVFHAHFHLIPRYPDDGLRHWLNGKYKEGEEVHAQEKITAELQ